MRYDGEVLTFERRQSEDTAHGSQFFTGIAAHDACLTEKRLDSGIRGGNSTCMTGGCTTATF